MVSDEQRTPAETANDRLTDWRHRALSVAAVAVPLALIGLLLDPRQFLRSYLLAYLFWIALPLGAWGFVALHHMVGGEWGRVIRRPLESAAATMPLMALLFVPLLFGLGTLYPWARPEEVAGDPLLVHKQPYLNVPFFVLRAVVYFAVWIGMITLLNRLSARQRSEDDAVTRRLQLLSGVALPVYGLTVTFAVIDWGMSLEPHWFSTIYGMLFVAGQGLATPAFATLALAGLADLPPLAGVVRARHFHDLGNLTLAFVMLWAYMAYSQYLIIWSGNLPEEITWYLHRGEGGWQYIGLMLLVLHFAVPFMVLLGRRVKRNAARLAAVAVGILCLRFVDVFWLIVPAFFPGVLALSWLDVVVPAAMGAVWVAAWTRHLGSWPLLPFGASGRGAACGVADGIPASSGKEAVQGAGAARSRVSIEKLRLHPPGSAAADGAATTDLLPGGAS